MAEPVARAEGHARTPSEGPGTTEEEIARRQARLLNASRNGELMPDGSTRPFLTAQQSKTS